MNYLKSVSFFILIIFFSSCGSVNEAFNNQKKNSSDEFLVEKKSPLVMPPDYNELPVPQVEQNQSEPKEEKIKGLIKNNQDVDIEKTQNNNEQGKSFEENILKKIKKN